MHVVTIKITVELFGELSKKTSYKLESPQPLHLLHLGPPAVTQTSQPCELLWCKRPYRRLVSRFVAGHSTGA